MSKLLTQLPPQEEGEAGMGAGFPPGGPELSPEEAAALDFLRKDTDAAAEG